MLNILFKYLSQTGLLSLMFYTKEAQRFHHLVSENFEFVEKCMICKKVLKLMPTMPKMPTMPTVPLYPTWLFIG